MHTDDENKVLTEVPKYTGKFNYIRMSSIEYWEKRGAEEGNKALKSWLFHIINNKDKSIYVE